MQVEKESYGYYYKGSGIVGSSYYKAGATFHSLREVKDFALEHGESEIVITIWKPQRSKYRRFTIDQGNWKEVSK